MKPMEAGFPHIPFARQVDNPVLRHLFQFRRHEPFSLLIGLTVYKISLERTGMTKIETLKGSKMVQISNAFDPVEAALKQMHHTVSTESIPDDFVRILDEIDAKIAAAKTVR